MNCSKCNHKYSADWNQPAPGGSSAPGVFTVLAVVFLSPRLLLSLSITDTLAGFAWASVCSFRFRRSLRGEIARLRIVVGVARNAARRIQSDYGLFEFTDYDA
jgi:hypothetical protein